MINKTREAMSHVQLSHSVDFRNLVEEEQQQQSAVAAAASSRPNVLNSSEEQVRWESNMSITRNDVRQSTTICSIA